MHRPPAPRRPFESPRGTPVVARTESDLRRAPSKEGKRAGRVRVTTDEPLRRFGQIWARCHARSRVPKPRRLDERLAVGDALAKFHPARGREARPAVEGEPVAPQSVAVKVLGMLHR